MYAWRTRTIHDLHEPQPNRSAPTTMPRRIRSLRWNVQPSAIAESTLRSRGRPFKHLAKQPVPLSFPSLRLLVWQRKALGFKSQGHLQAIPVTVDVEVEPP